MDKKKCANCGKEIDLDDKSSFKTCMHNQMHRYVCDSKCMMEFYGYKPKNRKSKKECISCGNQEWTIDDTGRCESCRRDVYETDCAMCDFD